MPGGYLRHMVTAIVALVVTGCVAGLLVWAHWPQRMGALAEETDPEALDASIEEVGNVDRPRVAGEDGVGGGGGFPGH